MTCVIDVIRDRQVVRVQAESSGRHSSQPTSSGRADPKPSARALNQHRSKLSSDSHQRSVARDHLATHCPCPEAAQEVTASSEGPLVHAGNLRSAGAEARTNKISRDKTRLKHVHPEASIGSLNSTSQPHAEFRGMNEQNVQMKKKDATPLMGKAKVQLAVANCTPDRYAAQNAFAFRGELRSRVESSSTGIQNMRPRPDEPSPAKFSDRHTIAHPDLMPELRLQSDRVGPRSRDGSTSPARSMHHVSDQSLIASPAAQFAGMARFKDDGAKRMCAAAPYSSLRPTTSAGASSSDRISAGIEEPAQMRGLPFKTSNLSRVLFTA
jgi:hypothetical protein